MTRVLRAVVYNWPLKVAAILLATLLYAGFVVSQTATDLPDVAIPIEVLNQPADSYLLTNLSPVTQIRYFAAEDAPRPTVSTFRATIDLANVDPQVGSTYVPIQVQSLDPRITVLSWEPPGLTVELEPIVEKEVEVRVFTGPTPDGVEVREPVVDPETVTISGPESLVRRVKEARADVVIEPSGINVDRDVPLIAVDAAGQAIPQVEVEPAEARVRIAVFSNREVRSLPVNPMVTGLVASGYEIVSVTTDPRVVSVEGDVDELVAITRADTAPVDVGGATANLVVDVPLALPDGVLAVDPTPVRVTVTIRPISGTRTFSAGLVLTGTNAGLEYELSAGTVLVVVGGPIVDLERLDSTAFFVRVGVAGLTPGSHAVTPLANLQAGLTVVSMTPSSVTVVVTNSPSPAPTASGP